MKCYLPLVFFIFSCGEKKAETNSTSEVFLNDTIPELRKNVSKKPVASYWVQMGNPKLERKFGVDVYETPFTFKYLLSMQYDAMPETDTLSVPNFGMHPQIKVIAGKEKLSCIIGFMDAKGSFREYKLLSAKNNNLRLSTLKYYSVGSSR
jgi:hypothetical protein